MAPQFSTTGGVGDGSESFGVKPRNMWPESMSDGTDAVTNSGIISKKVQQFYGAQRSDIQGQLMSPQAVQEIPGVMAAFGKTTQILKYPSGVVTSSVFLDKRTLNYSYGIV